MDDSQRSCRISSVAVLGLILAGALILRLLALAGRPIIPRDGVFYLEFCEQWFAEGDPFVNAMRRKPPLLSLYLAVALMHCGLTAENALIGLNLAAGTCFLIPVYLIARILFRDAAAGLAAAALAAVLPPLVEFSISPMRDILQLFFAAWALFGTLCALRKGSASPWGAFLSGASCVAAMQCRFEAFELLVLFGLFLFFGRSQNREGGGRPFLRLGLFFAGIAVAATLFEIAPGYPSIVAIYVERLVKIMRIAKLRLGEDPAFNELDDGIPL